MTGSGTELDPFIIETPQDLSDIRNDIGATGDLTYYEGSVDLDMSGFGTFSSIAGEAFVSLDMKGFSISDITIDGTGSTDTGLFEHLSSECLIDNITFIDPDVTGESRTGVLAGDGHGTVNNARVFGGSITDPDGNSTYGGLFGRFAGTANNSYVLGLTINTFDGGSTYAGFAGQLLFGSTVNKCWTAVGIVENGTVTGVAGFASNVSGSASINDCFWDTQVTNAPASDANATGKTTAEMQDINTFTDTATTGLDEAYDMVLEANHDGDEATAIWFIDDGVDYPKLWFEWEAGGGDQTITVTESASGSDEVLPTASLTVTEQADGSDVVTPDVSLSVSDEGSGDDNPSPDAQATVEDSGTGLDALQSLVVANVSDDILSDEGIIIEAQAVVTDSGQFVDVVELIVSALKQVQDSGSFTDSTSVDAQIKVQDLGQVSDVVGVLVDAIRVSDTAQVVEVVASFDDSTSVTSISIKLKPSPQANITLKSSDINFDLKTNKINIKLV